MAAEEVDISFDVGEAGRNWERPAPPRLRPGADSLGVPRFVLLSSKLQGGKPQTDIAGAAAFQQLEVDYTMSVPNRSLYRTDLAEVPVLRMFGVTPSGKRLLR